MRNRKLNSIRFIIKISESEVIKNKEGEIEEIRERDKKDD